MEEIGSTRERVAAAEKVIGAHEVWATRQIVGNETFSARVLISHLQLAKAAVICTRSSDNGVLTLNVGGVRSPKAVID